MGVEVLLKPKVKGVILLKLHDLLQSLPLDELPNSPTVSNLQQVRLEIIVSESKVEEQLRVVFHLFEFHLDYSLSDFADVDGWVDSICGDLEELVILELVALFLFEEAHRRLLSHLHEGNLILWG